MGDGSVRSVAKNIDPSVFYTLCASNVLPEPTEQEKALAEAEYKIVEMWEKYAAQEEEIKELKATLKLVQDQLKTEQKTQTQLTSQITNLTNQITALNVAPTEATAAVVTALQEQAAGVQEQLDACTLLVDAYLDAVATLQAQIQEKEEALEALKIANGDIPAPVAAGDE
jgi:chromosome segregation ATPase